MPTRPRRNISQRSELLYDAMEYDVHVDTREVFLHSHLVGEGSEEPGFDYRSADRFVKAMSFLESQGRNPVLVHVCSVGGSWEYGMAIHDRIATSPCLVTTLSHAHARSMSGVLIQAADVRVLMPNCDVLVHFGTLSLPEDRHEHAVAEAEWSKLQNERMLELYAARCCQGPFFRRKRYSRAGVAGYLRRRIRDRAEWYMTGREAVDYGFADAVLGDEGFETIDVVREG